VYEAVAIFPIPDSRRRAYAAVFHRELGN